MIFREKAGSSVVWQRFRSGLDEFEFRMQGEHTLARVVATSDNAVGIYLDLLKYLPSRVEVAVEDCRMSRQWVVPGIEPPELHAVLSRISTQLAIGGGVEMSAYTGDDQLSLNRNLELFIYSRSDRWYYLLKRMGITESAKVYSRSWSLSATEFPPSPDLSDAVVRLVAELTGIRPA